MTGALIRKRKLDTETHREEGHVTMKAEIGGTHLSQGMSVIASKHQKLGEARNILP